MRLKFRGKKLILLCIMGGGGGDEALQGKERETQGGKEALPFLGLRSVISPAGESGMEGFQSGKNPM